MVRIVSLLDPLEYIQIREEVPKHGFAKGVAVKKGGRMDLEKVVLVTARKSYGDGFS